MNVNEQERWVVLACFAGFGLLFGIWQVLLADLQQAVHLSNGELGSLLTTGFLAAFPALLYGGRWVDRWGQRRVISGAALAMAVAFVGISAARQPWQLAIWLLLFYGGSGAYDVGINAAAIALEQRLQRPFLPYAHGSFSGAAALGSIMAGLLLYLQLPFRLGYGLIMLELLLLTLAVWFQPKLDADVARTQADALVRRRLMRAPALLLLAGITALAFLAEGTLETWSGIYLRSALVLPALLGAAGPAVFHSAMLLGRLASARLQTWLGRRGLLVASGLLAALGMGLALLTTYPALILAGLLLAGLALAGVAPTAFSLAGDAAPAYPGAASAVLTLVGYTGFLLGPVVIGWLTELFGFRWALSLLVVAGLAISWAGRRVSQHVR